MRFLTFDTNKVFEEPPQLIGNSIHLHFGQSFGVEFASFPIFTVPGKEKLHAVLWAKIRYQGLFRDHIDLKNTIDSRVVSLLHWEAETVFQICIIRLYQERGFYFLW